MTLRSYSSFFNVSFNGSLTGKAYRLRHAKKSAYSHIFLRNTSYDTKKTPTKIRTSNPISASRYLYNQMLINKSRWGKDYKRC